ncbi:HAD family hydrolase [Luteolibacter algae]|uniref:sucrose-phosphate synthase n=1 Tax=Luteolibacter algae TaxID=454151 RepID=A0ABW5DCV7_9BACT
MSTANKTSPKRKLDILHISIHGLIRGENLELGRDPDTGGQCLYVLELVKALAKDERVKRVSLVTRKVIDSKLSPDYAKSREKIDDIADIIRIEAGPRRYLRKEIVWRHLDAFIDGTLAYLRREKRVPDLIHAHYADAGYVGRQIAAVLGCPFVFTGHSLGRVKRQRLVEGGVNPEEMEKRYNLGARIEAEELSLDAASMVCTSTRQEVEEQYALYDQHTESRMRVIPPGVDLTRFDGDGCPEIAESVNAKLERFLNDTSKPPVLTIARADERKNLPGLVRAFAKNKWLRENANLIVIGGNREELDKLPPGTRKVWLELLRTFDDSDLYGIAAYPKNHKSQEVAGFYRWAAERKGLFVNPAFTEPFGLTLLEAAAAGLPLVATHDGGPRDIIANCKNGTLIDPLNDEEMGDAIEAILSDPTKYEELTTTGHREVRNHYSWAAHVATYLDEVYKIIPEKPRVRSNSSIRGALVERDRWIVMDLLPRIENESEETIARWRDLFENKPVGFGIATGLSFDEAWEVIHRCGMPQPGFVISSLGAEIRYGETGVPDERWNNQVRNRWNREGIVEAFSTLDCLSPQDDSFQHKFKVSYFMDSNKAMGRVALQRILRENGISAKVIVTAKAFVDVIPVRSGKDVALRYLENRWGIDPARIFYFGSYGNDIAAVRGRNLSVLAADSDRVLRQLLPRPRLFHASLPGLSGMFEGLDHYQFIEGSKPPKPHENEIISEEDVPEIELHP